MATSYTSLLGFALPVTGELDGTWGDVVNNSITQLVEDSVAGVATTSVAAGDWTLTTTGSGAANQARCAILIPTGSPGVSRNIIAPSQSKAYIVVNQSDAAVVLKGSATTGTTIATGTKALCAWNGSDYVTIASADVNNLTGVLPSSKGGTGLTGFTAANNALYSTSSSALAAGTLPVAAGGTGITSFGTGVATALGQNVTGSGGMVLNTSPTLTTPNLGTPSALTLTNAISLPLTTGVTGILPIGNGGTGVSTIAAKSIFVANSLDTLTTVTPSAGQSVRINAGGTAWEAFTPSTASGDAVLSAANAFTGANTFYNNTGQTFGTGTSTQDGIIIAGGANNSSSYRVTISPASLSASRSVTFPDAAGTVVLNSATQTLTNKRIDPRVSSTSSTASITPDVSSFDQYCVTAQAASLTINAPIGTPVNGTKLIFRILDNGTPRSLSWNATYTVIGVVLPTATTVNKMLYVGCIYNSANTRWDVVAVTTQA